MHMAHAQGVTGLARDACVPGDRGRWGCATPYSCNEASPQLISMQSGFELERKADGMVGPKSETNEGLWGLFLCVCLPALFE